MKTKAQLIKILDGEHKKLDALASSLRNHEAAYKKSPHEGRAEIIAGLTASLDAIGERIRLLTDQISNM